jgi:hypothetical protein
LELTILATTPQSIVSGAITFSTFFLTLLLFYKKKKKKKKKQTLFQSKTP